MTVEDRDDTSVSQGYGNKRNCKNKGLRGACEELKENVQVLPKLSQFLIVIPWLAVIFFVSAIAAKI